MAWGHFASGGACARHITDGIMRKNNRVGMLKQNLKISPKLCFNWTETFSVVAKWIQDNSQGI